MKHGSLFTGFGGWDIGAKAAGLELAWGLEYDPEIAAVANANLGDHVRVADIQIYEGEGACTLCEGWKRVDDGDDPVSWKDWEGLPYANALAIRLGIVKPIRCPRCNGTGKEPNDNERKLTTKYAFYYPENDEQFLGMPEYDSVEEALEAWQDRRSSWEVIPAKGKNLAAFLNSRTGDIVALREKE